MVRAAVIASVLVVTPSIGIAQSTSAQSAKAVAIPSTDKSDVNRIVCRKEEQIGSRLGGKRLCLTVQEWLDRAQSSREETERVQQQAPTRISG